MKNAHREMWVQRQVRFYQKAHMYRFDPDAMPFWIVNMESAIYPPCGIMSFKLHQPCKKPTGHLGFHSCDIGMDWPKNEYGGRC